MKISSVFAKGTRLFNLVETSTITVQKLDKTIVPKSSEHLDEVMSVERGTIVTTFCIISVSGVALKTVMVFPIKNFEDFMNTPRGTLGLVTPTGWINCQIFQDVIKHLINHTNTALENPSIPIMESHLSLEALDVAKA